MKKLIMLVQKYVCGRSDMHFGTASYSNVLPLVQYGRLDGFKEDVVGRYLRITMPSFRFGFEYCVMRRKTIAAWRVPVLAWIRWSDGDSEFQRRDEIWEEDRERTMDEEVRELNRESLGKTEGGVYSIRNGDIHLRLFDMEAGGEG